MQEYLAPTSARLVISNAKSFIEYQGEHKEENDRYVKELRESFGKDEKKYALQMESLQEMGNYLEGSVCMLDMRGEKSLSPGEKWDYIVFGGVLGDHPPRDRPAPLRKHFCEIRQLGTKQLATDTAVLVSKLILCNKIPINDIPMI